MHASLKSLLSGGADQRSITSSSLQVCVRVYKFKLSVSCSFIYLYGFVGLYSYAVVAAAVIADCLFVCLFVCPCCGRKLMLTTCFCVFNFTSKDQKLVFVVQYQLFVSSIRICSFFGHYFEFVMGFLLAIFYGSLSLVAYLFLLLLPLLLLFFMLNGVKNQPHKTVA